MVKCLETGIQYHTLLLTTPDLGVRLGELNQKYWSSVEHFRMFGWARCRCCSDQPVTDLWIRLGFGWGRQNTLMVPEDRLAMTCHATFWAAYKCYSPLLSGGCWDCWTTHITQNAQLDLLLQAAFWICIFPVCLQAPIWWGPVKCG